MGIWGGGLNIFFSGPKFPPSLLRAIFWRLPMAFSDFKMHFWGFKVSGLCRGTGRLHRKNRKGGTASLRSRTCVKPNAVFGARFKGLSLHFLYKKTDTYQNGLGYISDTYPNPYPPCHGTPFMIILDCKNSILFMIQILSTVCILGAL